ncbi:hypothetical protein B8V81_3272 [Paenibacillus pasadenensis]|uniref:Uncharacterized protein n=1 Tax=Paenibacillus pasadenensis TaxID=217090 RepID=A0A2N5N3C6_9BACL|nr:hypothetical protein B8V81_3272 [Paenibacillus pasadenensis]
MHRCPVDLLAPGKARLVIRTVCVSAPFSMHGGVGVRAY